MSAICLACCRDRCSREIMTLVFGLRQRETLSIQTAFWLTAQLTPDQVKSRPLMIRGSGLEHCSGPFLMSNILPFDKSSAKGHRADDVTAGNDEEWCVRKLINVGKGVKHLPVGCRTEQQSESMKLCSASFDQPANLRRLTAYESVMRCLSPSSTSPLLFQAGWQDCDMIVPADTLGIAENCPPYLKIREERLEAGSVLREMIPLW